MPQTQIGDIVIKAKTLPDNRIVNNLDTVIAQFDEEDKFMRNNVFRHSKGEALVNHREESDDFVRCFDGSINIGKREYIKAVETFDRDQQTATVEDRRNEVSFYKPYEKYVNKSKCFKKRPLIPAVSFIPSATILNEQVGLNILDPSIPYDILTDGPEKTPDEGVCNSLVESRSYNRQKININRLLSTRQKALRQVRLTMNKINPDRERIIDINKHRERNANEIDRKKLTESIVKGVGEFLNKNQQRVRQLDREESQRMQAVERAISEEELRRAGFGGFAPRLAIMP
ncbi:MAG: hypothetical protein ACXAAH_06715 [Promethearchaeota archaeon]|jgi:hypothetical protein